MLRISVPTLSARVDPSVLASTLARLLASSRAQSKSDLVRETGLARSTVDAGVDRLLERSTIRRAGFRQVSGRGRAAQVLELNPDYGRILVADCGRNSGTLNVFDFRQEKMASKAVELDFTDGPKAVLDRIVRDFELLLTGLPTAPARAAVIGLPGPVDHRSGAMIRPPFMPGWDRFPVTGYIEQALGCEVILENDVALRALGEARAAPDLTGPLVYVKLGTGIGGGIVTADGELLRGIDGSAGQIGHLKVAGATDLCSCGSYGCLETVASVYALTRKMLNMPPSAVVSRDQRATFIDRLAGGDSASYALVREAAQYVGEAVADLVHIVNPQRIVIGGVLGIAGDDLLATVRGIVYTQALPLSTRELLVVGPALAGEEGVSGGLVIGIEKALSPTSLED